MMKLKSKWLCRALSLLVGLALLTGCSGKNHALAPQSAPHGGEPLEQQTVLAVPYLSQEENLPTGCEATSAAMALQYWGAKATPEQVASLLPKGELYWREGELWGPDPNQAFIGSPFEETGYGCYAPVILWTLEQSFSRQVSVQPVYDSTISRLYEDYVKGRGWPVLIWVTIDLVEPAPGTQWRLEGGGYFTWKKNEHCMVLVGKQGEEYLCLDPYQSQGTQVLPEELLQLRFEQMGSQAIAVGPAG